MGASLKNANKLNVSFKEDRHVDVGNKRAVLMAMLRGEYTFDQSTNSWRLPKRKSYPRFELTDKGLQLKYRADQGLETEYSFLLDKLTDMWMFLPPNLARKHWRSHPRMHQDVLRFFEVN